MTAPLVLILLVLTAYRVWRFIALDSLIGGWRERFYNRFPPSAERAAQRYNGRILVDRAKDDPTRRREASKLAQLWTCGFCSGFWISCATFGILWHYRSIPLPGLWPLSVSAGVGVLSLIDKRLVG